MQILMIACSKKGYELMCRMRDCRKSVHLEDEIITKVKSSELVEIWTDLGELSEERKNELIHGSIREIVGEYFSSVDALVFIGAAGIAVRCIAPYLVHKSTDPAVVTIDEAGKYCISLLSGHMGGANELTQELAECIDAVPVITTATDCEGKFAVDDFARKNQFVLSEWKKAKEISVSVLKGDRLKIYVHAEENSACEIIGNLPEELEMCEDISDAKVFISPFSCNEAGHKAALQLIPKWITVGIGCKKDIPLDLVEEAVMSACEEAGIDVRSIKQVASIDLKREEAGLLAFCNKFMLPFQVYSADELQAVEGEFAESEFVKSITMVGNVCERSAVLASGGKLIFGKHAYNGVTVAFAMKTEAIRFE